jgi:hypothetical protein
LKTAAEIEYNSTDFHSAWKNHTTALLNHTYTAEVPEIVVSIYNHTWNATNVEELSAHVASALNHSKVEASTFNHSDIHQALFNYTKPVVYNTSNEAEIHSFFHTNHTYILHPTFNHSQFELAKADHTNITFAHPWFNHTLIHENITEEYAEFVEKHG